MSPLIHIGNKAFKYMSSSIVIRNGDLKADPVTIHITQGFANVYNMYVRKHRFTLSSVIFLCAAVQRRVSFFAFGRGEPR